MNLSVTETPMMPVFMFLLMPGMGATLSADGFRQILRHPRPALIGLASQYGWMPLIALVMALTLDLSSPVALGLIIMGCVAGGPISNFFTYLAHGDLTLSISMTVISPAWVLPFIFVIIDEINARAEIIRAPPTVRPGGFFWSGL